MKNLSYLFVSLFCLLFISGCDKLIEYSYRSGTNKLTEEEIKEKLIEEHRNRYRKANINGIPVHLPHGVGGLEIDGDSPFLSPDIEKIKSSRPDSSYENSIRTFGFDFEFKRNVIKGFVEYDGYVTHEEYAKDFLNPQKSWVNVILFAGKQYSGNTTKMNEFVNRSLGRYEPRVKRLYEKYGQVGELFGLEWYQANVPVSAYPEVKQSIREKNDDMFIQRDENGNVITFIRCDNTKNRQGTTDFQHCHQYTLLTDFNNAWLELDYLRVHLEYWQEIQQLAEQHIKSWVVEPNQVR